MLELSLYTGLIAGIVQALIIRIYFKSVKLNLLIITGSIFSSFLTYITVWINPKIGNNIVDALWKLLWQPLFGDVLGNYYGQLPFLFITIVLVQIAGSILGGLLGVRIWMTLFRF
jgi:hypothetical protein